MQVKESATTVDDTSWSGCKMRILWLLSMTQLPEGSNRPMMWTYAFGLASVSNQSPRRWIVLTALVPSASTRRIWAVSAYAPAQSVSVALPSQDIPVHNHRHTSYRAHW